MTSRGIRNNNPGNLRKTQDMWIDEIPGDDTDFKVFASSEGGIKALQRCLIIKFNRGLNTIYELIHSYAPSSENDTEAYINFIVDQTRFDEDQILDLNDIPTILKVIKAIILYENGTNPYSDNLIRGALCAA